MTEHVIDTYIEGEAGLRGGRVCVRCSCGRWGDYMPIADSLEPIAVYSAHHVARTLGMAHKVAVSAPPDLTRDLADLDPIYDDDSGTTYAAWTDGHSVGFRAERGGEVEYIYLSPSGGSDDGVANVFLCRTTDGEPGDPHHGPVCYFDLFDGEVGNPGRPGSLGEAAEAADTFGPAEHLAKMTEDRDRWRLRAEHLTSVVGRTVFPWAEEA